MTQAQQKVIDNIKSRQQSRAGLLLEKTKAIRKKISIDSGQWDAVKTLRDIRYAS